MINPAYLAGIVDSDGSLTISKRNINRKNPSYCCMFQLTWKKTDLTVGFITSLVNEYGGSFCDNTSSNAGHFKNPSQQFRCCITDNNLERLVLDVLPYLILKKQQALNILEARRVIHDNPHYKFDYLNALYLSNKELNTKNGKKYDSCSKF